MQTFKNYQLTVAFIKESRSESDYKNLIRILYEEIFYFYWTN